MTLEIRLLDRTKATLSKMGQIGRQCFGPSYSATQLENNWGMCDTRSVFYGVFVDKELVAFVGFLAHQAFRAEHSLLLFQACHVATHPLFRGKGMFSKIVNHAKASLMGDYIIGFPNSQADPIWVNRLGFQRVPLVRVYVPCLFAEPFLSGAKFSAAQLDPSLIRANQNTVAKWKAAEHPNEIITHEELDNFLWGRVVSRKIGLIASRALLIGGAVINRPRLLPHMLRNLGQKHCVSWTQFVCTETSPLAHAARLPLSGTKTEPLIWFALRESSEVSKFDIHNGIKDVW